MNLERMLRAIDQADASQIGDLFQATLDRYRTLFPQEEILYLSLPRNDPQERARLLEHFLTLIK